jgi:polysaccharide biosynthesis/export protein
LEEWRILFKINMLIATYFDTQSKAIMKPQNLILTLLFITAAVFGLGARAQDRQPEYQIGAGDVVRILVYQNPDLTLETRVTENGTITYPLIGLIKIGGMTVAAAELAIGNALKSGGFLKQPQVNVIPVQIRSNQISVLGQVNHPGRFPIETFNIRLSEMIAIAGGISATGADVAVLSGVRDGKPFRKEIDIAGMFLDNKGQDDVVVAGGDVIYVHRMPMFYIYGEVQRPGSYRVERGMTIRQALAQGGGLTPRGTEKRLGVFRRVGNSVVETNPNLNSPVRPDDVLFVGESLF